MKSLILNSTTQPIITSSLPSRRSFMGSAGMLSAGAVALLAGKDSLAQAMGGDMSKDAAILNVALGLEHEAINA
ncbi:MAG: hypothetical protein RI918_2230, partial [Pseudomonadota bacterium]